MARACLSSSHSPSCCVVVGSVTAQTRRPYSGRRSPGRRRSRAGASQGIVRDDVASAVGGVSIVAMGTTLATVRTRRARPVQPGAAARRIRPARHARRLRLDVPRAGARPDERARSSATSPSSGRALAERCATALISAGGQPRWRRQCHRRRPMRRATITPTAKPPGGCGICRARVLRDGTGRRRYVARPTEQFEPRRSLVDRRGAGDRRAPRRRSSPKRTSAAR